MSTASEAALIRRRISQVLRQSGGALIGGRGERKGQHCVTWAAGKKPRTRQLRPPRKPKLSLESLYPEGPTVEPKRRRMLEVKKPAPISQESLQQMAEIIGSALIGGRRRMRGAAMIGGRRKASAAPRRSAGAVAGAKRNPYVSFLKKYSKAQGITYGEAMSLASSHPGGWRALAGASFY